ncbi:MAG: hypothetical protein NT133_05295 [Alphaproteobacteria bacterium]|nr:hypothetical protein [Alphaproteobacteria bacterium]
MTHLPFILAAYGLTVVTALAFAISAWRRAGQARRRLAAVDPRGRDA